MHLTVSDMRSLIRVMDEKKIEYAVTSDQEADVYGDWNVTELIQSLAEQGCIVYKVTEKDESLESYYINLIGGGSHA